MKLGKLDRKRALKLRFRRHLRLQRRQVEEFGAQAEQRIENDFFRRLERLGLVRRFVSTWLLLVILLIGMTAAQIRALSGYYQVLSPVPGGTFTEGVLGTFTNANPIYATDLADTTVAELVFAGLLTYDADNQLRGDLAESWAVDAAGTTYTLKLKSGLTWHDGVPLTSADVVFTYNVIQNPDAQSPLFNSWSGIKVLAVDERTINFVLPGTLASFPYSLTTGIIPQHILGSVAMSDMRSISFNTTSPVGAGPFEWQAIELTGESVTNRQEVIALKPFDDYHAGKPKLAGFVIRTFREAEQMIASFKNKELTAVSGLTQTPAELTGDPDVLTYNLPLTAAVMAFFRTQDGLLASPKMRQALVRGADRLGIITELPYATQPVLGPLLSGQLAYNPQYAQAGYDPAVAKQLFDEEGWAVGNLGQRYKAGAPLTFSLYFLNSPEYTSVARQLARGWQALGADVKLVPQGESDFATVLANAPAPGGEITYDVLLYGITIGVDPDVYVYWHSSQIDLRSPTRLNFSEYKSATADEGLVGGRTRVDPALRSAKYQPFLQAWQADAPALSLYQPRFLYLTHGQIDGLEEKPINSDAGHLKNVQNWQIRQQWVTP
jgi:peptide/nickel transport system substrate-binding protein